MLNRISLTKYLYFTTNINIHFICKINHAHIHTYLASLWSRTFFCHKLISVRKASEISISISIRNNSHSCLSVSLVYSSIAYCCSGRVSLDCAYCCLKWHNRLKSKFLCKISISIEQKSWSYHVKPCFRISCNSTCIGTVSYLEFLSKFFLNFINHTGKQFKLMLSIAFIFFSKFIRYCKMCEYSLSIKTWKSTAFTYSFNTTFKIISVTQISKSWHSCINFNMNL